MLSKYSSSAENPNSVFFILIKEGCIASLQGNNTFKKSMKILLLFLTIVTLGIINSLKNPNFTVIATVENIASDLGNIGFTFCAKNHCSRAPFQEKEAHLMNGESRIVFESTQEGEYAFIGYHDKNNTDNKDFGAANNNMFFGRPRCK